MYSSCSGNHDREQTNSISDGGNPWRKLGGEIRLTLSHVSSSENVGQHAVRHEVKLEGWRIRLKFVGIWLHLSIRIYVCTRLFTLKFKFTLSQIFLVYTALNQKLVDPSGPDGFVDTWILARPSFPSDLNSLHRRSLCQNSPTTIQWRNHGKGSLRRDFFSYKWEKRRHVCRSVTFRK